MVAKGTGKLTFQWTRHLLLGWRFSLALSATHLISYSKVTQLSSTDIRFYNSRLQRWATVVQYTTHNRTLNNAHGPVLHMRDDDGNQYGNDKVSLASLDRM